MIQCRVALVARLYDRLDNGFVQAITRIGSGHIFKGVVSGKDVGGTAFKEIGPAPAARGDLDTDVRIAHATGFEEDILHIAADEEAAVVGDSVATKT